MHGWLPLTVQILTAAVLLLALGPRARSRRWWLLATPVAVLVGSGAALLAHSYITCGGYAGEPAPKGLWIWIALTGLAAVVLVLGWPGARWWRRTAAVAALPLCVLSAALALNLWVGYFPTVQIAWNQLTAGPLPDETDAGAVTALAHTVAQTKTLPAKGSVLKVDTGSSASGFAHRDELVYLPPAWFATVPPPTLPTVMMIGGEFNTPGDWLRAGSAIETADAFATAHHGNAPVLVFVDSGGQFNNDTECVNGPRGRVADHLVNDVRPYLISQFHVSPAAANWGVAGWSMGGTCAVDLVSMHPDKFSAFEDIAGDLAPSAGNPEQTLRRLYDGDKALQASFDPSTVITTHGRYQNVAGRFDVNGTLRTAHGPAVIEEAAHTLPDASDQMLAAQTLCGLGRSAGMDCAVIEQPGGHNWPFAAQAFRLALPWLAGAVGTPGVDRIPVSHTDIAPAAPSGQPLQAKGP
ncbi:alpha/beta hydrolase [Mycolicibacterium brumae]|uniref:Esterase family protein n=1 Tax=Mycolicibacterium brumae TaxID=85968 RepID=A0A2G5P7E5_9MYCO|nr:alpha/beta hydrolase-fold protein [Mycolicibacterium brumae]MCV7194559.1 esterase family protein [Mycolicibacterium brumae]PIB74225.1 hypothetical protein CQY22_013745 [Mycolicibacterium brumae]UWW08899.1 alpha/beta hydrolase-fold protein [Mycolicibacterium brumae]